MSIYAPWTRSSCPPETPISRFTHQAYRRPSTEGTFSCYSCWPSSGTNGGGRYPLSVTANPTAEWIARQITDAFPWNEAPDYLIRDREASYGQAVTRRLAAMGIRDHPTAPRSPWQNGHAERLIGSIRRECLDHTVVFGEGHLRRILAAYTGYYNECRTHLSLDKDLPDHRPIHRLGQLVAQPILGGLHHQYCRDQFLAGTTVQSPLNINQQMRQILSSR